MNLTDRLPEVAVYVVHLEDPPGSGRAACCGLLLPRLPEVGIRWGCSGCLRLAAAPAPLAPHPGEHHDYDMTCCRCGEPGYLFVGFHSPGETFRWSEAQPKEADHD